MILRNLYFHDPPESKDLVELQYSTYVWIDHCDFSTEGLTGDKDYYDGLLDITHVSSRAARMSAFPKRESIEMTKS